MQQQRLVMRHEIYKVLQNDSYMNYLRRHSIIFFNIVLISQFFIGSFVTTVYAESNLVCGLEVQQATLPKIDVTITDPDKKNALESLEVKMNLSSKKEMGIKPYSWKFDGQKIVASFAINPEYLSNKEILSFYVEDTVTGNTTPQTLPCTYDTSAFVKASSTTTNTNTNTNTTTNTTANTSATTTQNNTPTTEQAAYCKTLTINNAAYCCHVNVFDSKKNACEKYNKPPLALLADKKYCAKITNTSQKNNVEFCCKNKDLADKKQCEAFGVAVATSATQTENVSIDSSSGKGPFSSVANNNKIPTFFTDTAKTVQCPMGAALPAAYPMTQCNDGIDNDSDGKADYFGVDCITKKDPRGDGVLDIEPDPACIAPDDVSEEADISSGTIIPCTNKCTVSDIFRFINRVIVFFFKTILIPIFVLLIMHAGYKYITAEGNPSKKADLKKLLWNLVGGLLLILGSWLIVRTILTSVGYKDDLMFFSK